MIIRPYFYLVDRKFSCKQVLDIIAAWGNLNNSHLSELDLSGIDFSRTSMSEANLKDTKLQGSNLSHCDLTGAHLSYRLLVGSNMCDTIERGADFRKANLYKTDMTGAILKDATMPGGSIHV